MKKRRFFRASHRTSLIILLMVSLFPNYFMAQDKNMKYNHLTPEEKRVIINKGTEAPFTGKYYQFSEEGTYVCKRCNAPLFRSDDKFDASCGWPSFDDEIPGAIKRQTDADNIRTEIVCANCGAHLGHVFLGEGFTSKNIRHCVNSVSLNFIPAVKKSESEKAYFAGGCFWGVEHLFQQMTGVISTRVGYMGGHTANPTYEEVCRGNTGHVETVELIFDPQQVTYEKIARYFFQIHDPTQVNRQGPDYGEQYRSVVFYASDDQKQTAEKLIKILKKKGYKVATQLEKADHFWEAEKYHQDYYNKKGTLPYCHFFQKRFD